MATKSVPYLHLQRVRYRNKAESSEAKKSAAVATSSCRLKRPMGILETNLFLNSWGTSAKTPVSMGPELMTLTRIFPGTDSPGPDHRDRNKRRSIFVKRLGRPFRNRTHKAVIIKLVGKLQNWPLSPSNQKTRRGGGS